MRVDGTVTASPYKGSGLLVITNPATIPPAITAVVSTEHTGLVFCLFLNTECD